MVPGTIVMWAGQKDRIPPGWHACDGATLSTSEYPELYLVLGDSFGEAPDGSFCLPDLRGQRARGAEDEAAFSYIILMANMDMRYRSPWR